MQKILLILNPCAGRLQGGRQLPRIKTILSGTYAVTEYITKAQGDAMRAATELAKRYDVVACCGGDGTLNEVICGLMTLQDPPPLGYIPAGSTNDFATSLKIPREISAAARRICTGSPKALDIGCCNGRYFSYIASLGAFTEASYKAPQNLKNSIGHLAYILEGIKDLSKIRGYDLTVTADAQTYTGRYIFAAVCNSTSVGGLVRLNPAMVDFSDGLFEVLLVKFPANVAELGRIVNAVTTRTFTDPLVTLTHAARVEIACSENIAWSLDGEYAPGGKQNTIVNQHHALQFIL